MTSKKSSLTDISVMIFLAVTYLLMYLIDTLVNQEFHTELSPLIPGGLTFEATGGGPFEVLLSGFLIKGISLAVALAATWFMMVNIKRGQLYTRKTAIAVRTVSFAIFAWGGGALIEHMGNNFAATRLGVEDLWDGPLFMSTSTIIVVWVLFSILYILERSINSAISMQQEVEDLV